MADVGPLEEIARGPMHPRQILAIAILTACTAVEGFDVYAISFAAPGIAQAWHIDRAMLGVVLAMDLVGMGIGSVLIGLIADRIGRKPVIVSCLVIMATGMLLAALSPGILILSAARLYTGFGIGGMLATNSAMAAELSNDRRRSLAITLLVGGFSIGAIAGGTLVSELLADNGRWQIAFEAGALITAILFVPALLWVPESLEFLCRRQPRNALVQVNAILRRLGHHPVNVLPSQSIDPNADPRGLPPEIALTALRLTIAFFMYMVSLYFLMKWIPKLVADMGYPASSAGGVLVWAHVGGLAGTALISLLSQVWNLRQLVAGAMACGAVAVALFGSVSEGLEPLTIVAAAAGLFIIGGNSAFYSIVAESFPPQYRAAGTGFVIGAGRAGAAVGPIAAGFLFEAGWPLSIVSVAMATGCLIAACAVSVRLRPRIQAVPSPAQ